MSDNIICQCFPKLLQITFVRIKPNQPTNVDRWQEIWKQIAAYCVDILCAVLGTQSVHLNKANRKTNDVIGAVRWNCKAGLCHNSKIPLYVTEVVNIASQDWPGSHVLSARTLQEFMTLWSPNLTQSPSQKAKNIVYSYPGISVIFLKTTIAKSAYLLWEKQKTKSISPRPSATTWRSSSTAKCFCTLQLFWLLNYIFCAVLLWVLSGDPTHNLTQIRVSQYWVYLKSFLV